MQKGKFRRPSSAPEARKERSCQSYSASLNEERSARFIAQHLSWFNLNLRSRRLEVMGTKKTERARHAREGRGSPLPSHVFLARPVFSLLPSTCKQAFSCGNEERESKTAGKLARVKSRSSFFPCSKTK